jgi:signal transduction histidine kinase
MLNTQDGSFAAAQNTMFSQEGLHPHVFSFSHNGTDHSELLWTLISTDAFIGLAFATIAILLFSLVRKIKIGYSPIFLCFGVFLSASALSHFMTIYTFWEAAYHTAAAVKILVMITAIGTAFYLFRMRRAIVLFADSSRIAEQRRLDLVALTHSLEEKVEKRTTELKSALHTRDDFLSVASHEFRTPLTTLKLKIGLMKRQGLPAENDPEKVTKFVNDVEAQVDRLHRLVDELLDIAKVKAGNLSMVPETIDLCDLTQKTLDRFALQFKEANIQVEFQSKLGLLASADPVRVEQVLNSLFINAIRYGAHAPLKVACLQTKKGIELSVHNGGPSIAPANANRIFERYERLESNQHTSGLGVGLYLSKVIMDAHQGSIYVDTKAPGARFVVEFPFLLEGYANEISFARSA